MIHGAFFDPSRGLRPLDPRACGRPWGPSAVAPRPRPNGQNTQKRRNAGKNDKKFHSYHQKCLSLTQDFSGQTNLSPRTAFTPLGLYYPPRFAREAKATLGCKGHPWKKVCRPEKSRVWESHFLSRKRNRGLLAKKIWIAAFFGQYCSSFRLPQFGTLVCTAQ